MSPWGWKTKRTQGIWRHGAAWTRPILVAVPWINLLLLLTVIWMTSGTLTKTEGTLFELPVTSSVDCDACDLVAFLTPSERDTTLFFDDARYVLSDVVSAANFREQLKRRMAKCRNHSMLVLSDRRVPCGELMILSSIARNAGVRKLLFAGKGESTSE